MNETTLLSLLFIGFFSSGGFLVYKGISYILVGNIIEAIVYMFLGLIFLFLGGLMVYACLRKINKKTAKK